MSPSLYDILGVKRDAEPKEIVRAYRRAARKHHPDANPGDEDAAARFRAVREAYEVLSDPKRREQYDRTGDTTPPRAGTHADIINVVQNALFDILHSYSASGAPVEEADIVEMLTYRVEGFASQLKNNLANLKRGEKTLAAAVDRFRVDGDEPNLLREMVADKLRACRNNQQDCEAEIAKLGRVMDYLKKCHYDVRERDRPPGIKEILEGTGTWKTLGWNTTASS